MNEVLLERPFDVTEVIEPTQWLVEGLIPKEMLGLLIAQAGVGKSFWGEGLAVAVAFGEPFMGRETEVGDVMVIDQDTPTPILKTRLHNFSAAYLKEGKTQKGKIWERSYRGYDFKSMATEINKYSTLKLAIVDCLTTISGGLDLNRASDMKALMKFKEDCIRPGLAILILHHISEKRPMPIDVLMCDDPHAFSMFSSVINAQADYYYIAGSPDVGGTLKELYLRPVSKRVVIRTKPFVTTLIEESGTLRFNGTKPYETMENVLVSDIEGDIIELFKATHAEDTSGVEFTVEQVYKEMKETHGICTIRDAMNRMYRPKGLLFRGKARHNLFKYRLVELESNKNLKRVSKKEAK